MDSSNNNTGNNNNSSSKNSGSAGSASEKRSRGKAAIAAVHSGIVKEDEPKVDLAISDLYGVGGDEAAEIHANYHMERVFSMLERRAREYGMGREALRTKIPQLDLKSVSFQVARGHLAEAAAVDVLFRSLSAIESRGNPSDDRYVNFYG